MKSLLALLLIAICFPWGLSSQKAPLVTIPNGFGTGADFASPNSDGYMNARERQLFAAGFVDGLLSSGLLGAPNDQITTLQSCVVGMTGPQVAAIIEKYTVAHPEEWHLSLTQNGFQAIGQACHILPRKN